MKWKIVDPALGNSKEERPVSPISQHTVRWPLTNAIRAIESQRIICVNGV